MIDSRAMIEIETSKDIKQHEPKIVGPFSARQLTCVSIAGVLGFMLLRYLPFDLLANAIISIVVISPIVACGWYKVLGIPLNKFIMKIIKSKFIDKKRVFRQENELFTGETEETIKDIEREEVFY